MLAQIGEFAFVLLSRASNLHLVEVDFHFMNRYSEILSLLIVYFDPGSIVIVFLLYYLGTLLLNDVIRLNAGEDVPSSPWNDSA